MNQYIINIYCHRLGYEVEETVTPKQEDPWGIFQVAEEQHMGDCGHRRDPCDAEAIGTGHSIQKVSE